MNDSQKLDYNKQIIIDFNWWEISWNSWLLVLKEFLEKINLKKLLEKFCPETRDWNFINTKPEIIYQKITRIVSWSTSNNNYIYEKEDPVFKEIHNWKIASSATCSRLENMFDYSDVWKIKKIQKALENYNIDTTKPKEIIIDLDSTNDPASWNLEYSSFIPHYWLEWYSPLFAINGLNWDLIGWVLKPWKYHCSTLSENFLKDIFEFYEWKDLEKTKLRWDSAFSTPKIYELCEEKWVEFFIKLKSNSALLKKVEWKWRPWHSIFEEFVYKAKCWEKSRRVIACIDWWWRETEASKKNRKKNPKLKVRKQLEIFPIYSFVVTNNEELEKEEVFSMYNGRSTIEDFIEEAKNGFGIDHLSNSKFKVNSVNFQIILLSMQILQLFRKFTMAKESKEKIKESKTFTESKKVTKKFKKKKKWRKEITLPNINTIRKKIFNIPGKMIKTWRYIYFKCATSFKFQNLFMSVLRKVQKLQFLII